MDKVRLQRIEREKASQKSILLARQMEGTEHIIQARMIEESVLQMTFFEVEKLRKGNIEPMFRTFLWKGGYINQDLSTEKTKWFTSSLENLHEVHLYKTKYYQKDGKWESILEECVGCTGKDKQVVRQFFKQYEKETDKCIPWQSVYRFQEEIMNRKLEEKRKKEKDKIDAVMETVKSIPDDFEEWVKNIGMADKRYLVYKPKEGQKADVFCNNCNKKMEVSRKEVYLRNNHKAVCPMCGHEVTIKVLGRMPVHICDKKTVSLVQKTEKGFLWRRFSVTRRLLRYGLKTEDFITEVERTFYELEHRKAHIADKYIWGEYKQTGEVRWCKTEAFLYPRYRETLLYPSNLPKEWEHTPMKYSALEIMAKKERVVEYDYEAAIQEYLNFNRIEHLIKMGLTKLVGELFRLNQNINLQTDAKNIFAVLGLDKEKTRILQKINGDHRCLMLLQAAKEKGIRINEDEVTAFCQRFGYNAKLLKRKRKNMSMEKFIRYFQREADRCSKPQEKNGVNALARDWVDYIRWCEELGYDLSDDYYYMPKNFKTAHENMLEEYKIFINKKRTEQKRKEEENVKKQLAVTCDNFRKVLKEGEYKSGKEFVILIPHNADEIREEGKSLHHCVGTYINKVATGETCILFVRRQDDMQTPYFTMEWRNGHIEQCRGAHNCLMPKKLQLFTDVFEKKMQNRITERNCYEKK